MKRAIRSSVAALLAVVLCAGSASAQQAPGEAWTLKRCIDYALENNLSMKQYRLRAQAGEIEEAAAQNSRLPAVSAGLNSSLSFGRSIGIDNTSRNTTQLSAGASIDASVPIFGGMRIKHSIRNSRLNLKAMLSDIDNARDDISLGVTSLYLQVLFNMEMVDVTAKQVEISSRLEQTNKVKFDAGKIAESTLAESRSQLAKDRYNLVQQQNMLESSLLDLKQLLNMEAATSLQIAVPGTDAVALGPDFGNDANIESIYGIASVARPSIQAEKYRLEASKANIDVARSQLYPQISAGAGYSNGYYHTYRDQAINRSFSDQFKDNASEYIGLNINIPIFNRFDTRNRIRSAKVSSMQQQIAVTQAEQKLRKDIEQAYLKARAAKQQFMASEESVAAARLAFRYEEEKTQAGVSTLYDYDMAKTHLMRSESEMVQAKYEYLFSTKVLDFYMGGSLDFKN